MHTCSLMAHTGQRKPLLHLLYLLPRGDARATHAPRMHLLTAC